MELYIDIIFLVSWGMDAFLLWAAGRLSGFRAKKRRILCGGLLSAAVYVLWLCFFGRRGGALLSLLLLLLGIAVAYFPKRLRNGLRLFAAAVAASFLMGGGVTMLFTLTGAQRMFGRGLVMERMYPWWLLPWAVGMAYLLLKGADRWLAANIHRRREYCTAAVFFRGRVVEGRMLIDTGNGLRKDGRGVAVVQQNVLLPLFPMQEQVRLLAGERKALGLEWMPFTSLGNPDGRLWGIRAERLSLSFGEATVVHRNIFVGMNQEEFTGAYEGLVPPCLLEEESI